MLAVERTVGSENHLRQLWWDMIVQTLEQLSPNQREAFILSHYHSRGLRDIARSLALPLEEAERLLSEADSILLANLRNHRRELGSELTAAKFCFSDCT
jgi:DNA-directed RNA polymerase specialized sigma24 family protein